jgi:TonB family protein
MAPLTKEAGASSAQESSVQQSSTQARSGGQRPDAVSLEVPIKIHGSRVTAVIRDITPQTEPFEEQTTTIIVFPQGGVLRMATGVSVAQMLVLTNLKSRQDAICRVVKVRSFPNMPSYVEVEFTQPQAKFWGVYFPSEGGTSKREPSTPAPQLGTKHTAAPANLSPSVLGQDVAAPKPVKAGVYSKEASPVKPPSAPPPAKPASSFVSLGSQEKIQPAAVAMSRSEENSPRPPTGEKQTYATEPLKINVALGLAMPPAAEAESLPRRDSTNDAQPSAASVANDLQPKHATLGPEAIANTDDIFGSLGSEALASDTAATSVESFGAQLDAGIGRSGLSAAEPRQNWMLIAACIAVLFGAVASGVWYFRSKPQANSANVASSPVSSTAQSTASSPTESPASTEPLPAALPSSSTPAAGQTNFNATPHATPSAGSSVMATRTSAAKSEDSVPAEPKTAGTDVESTQAAPRSMFASKMKARPLSSARSLDSQNQAPVLDATEVAAPDPGELPGVGSSSIAVPPPPGAAPEGSVTTGVAMKEPTLISSVLPVYPSVARQARVQGDVVVDTQIDKNGNVARMNVVSGPTMLRQAALDALRRWKYQPQELDGKPVEGELLVKIKFRL